MDQSNVIFAFLFLAYAAFITMRGELPKYAGFLLLSPAGGLTADNSKLASTVTSAALDAVAVGL